MAVARRSLSKVKNVVVNHKPVVPQPKQPLTVADVPGKVRRIGLVAIKRGMMPLWDQWGVRYPVTVLQLDDLRVTQRKVTEKEGYDSIQVACTDKLEHRVRRSERGHFEAAGVPAKRKVIEFRVSPPSAGEIELGTALNVAHFVPGQLVDVSAKTIGKGFQGAMKRWNFGGLPASHGVSLSHRSHGATGQRQDPGRVFKGKKMAGHLGNERVTIQNLLLFKIDTVLNLLFVKGAVPGNKGSYVRITDSVKRPTPSQAPFPTYLPGIHPEVPREIVMPKAEVDPLVKFDAD